MSDFCCSVCRKSATEDNKVKEVCGRLVHAKGCDYKPPEKVQHSCKRCGVNIALVNPVLLEGILGGAPSLVSIGPSDDALCAFCVVQLHGVEKAKAMLKAQPLAAALTSGTVVIGGKEFGTDWGDYLSIVKASAKECEFPVGYNTTGTLPTGQMITFGVI